MPTVRVSPLAGPFVVNYEISTPSTSRAEEIDASYPTLLMLHGGLMPSEFWDGQFTNPDLRRVNLVAMDLRKHGRSVGGDVSSYTFEEAADDVYQFMTAIGLPPCFVTGVSLGASIALHLSLNHPSLVLGLLMISPLPWKEPAPVAAGRSELIDIWEEAIESRSLPLLWQTVRGATQMGLNEATGPFIDVLMDRTTVCATAQWSTPRQIRTLRVMTVDLLVTRTRIEQDVLSRITCPVLFVYAGADVAYPLPLIEEVRDDFVAAGLDVELATVKGAPHFPNVTHPEPVNALLWDFIRRKSAVPPFAGTPDTTSPFIEELQYSERPVLEGPRPM